MYFNYFRNTQLVPENRDFTLAHQPYGRVSPGHGAISANIRQAHKSIRQNGQVGHPHFTDNIVYISYQLPFVPQVAYLVATTYLLSKQLSKLLT